MLKQKNLSLSKVDYIDEKELIDEATNINLSVGDRSEADKILSRNYNPVKYKRLYQKYLSWKYEKEWRFVTNKAGKIAFEDL